jgi:hypothetical protein
MALKKVDEQLKVTLQNYSCYCLITCNFNFYNLFLWVFKVLHLSHVNGGLRASLGVERKWKAISNFHIQYLV